jgi:hypothetical protein
MPAQNRRRTVEGRLLNWWRIIPPRRGAQAAPDRHVFARLSAQDCAAGSEEALSAVDFGRLERSSLANGKPHP